MGRAGARGAMRELADQMQGPSEREHPMMAMVTNGQRTAARSAPLLLDCQFDACELRVYWPAIRHESPLLVQDMGGNQHTIDRPICVLAFYRIIDFYRFLHVFVAATVRFQVQDAVVWSLWLDVSPEAVCHIDHEQRPIRRIGDARGGGVHEVCQAPVLFGIPKVKLDLAS